MVIKHIHTYRGNPTSHVSTNVSSVARSPLGKERGEWEGRRLPEPQKTMNALAVCGFMTGLTTHSPGWSGTHILPPWPRAGSWERDTNCLLSMLSVRGQ